MAESTRRRCCDDDDQPFLPSPPPRPVTREVLDEWRRRGIIRGHSVSLKVGRLRIQVTWR